MEFFQNAVNFFSILVSGIGGVTVIAGFIDFGNGQGNDNAALKDAGSKKIMGGGIIIATGLFLVPQLADMIHI